MNIAMIAAVVLAVIAVVMLISDGDKDRRDAYMESSIENYADDDHLVNVYMNGEICEMPLGEYLMGVVSCEMPASYDLEALKAQAMAARTYTAYKLEKGGCDKSDDADICTDPSHCQAYGDEKFLREKWGADYEMYAEKIEESVRSTDGKVITYDGRLIQALYTASCGGVTEDAQNVFGNALPYLVSVESADGDEKEKVYTYSIEDYAARLTSYNNNINISPSTAKTRTEKPVRYDSGRVEYVRISGIEVSGGTMRKIFSLPSTMFTIKFNGNDVIFTCKGYGHGVGLSQVGADGYAKKGLTAEKIVAHYYTGTAIESISEKIK